jgi:hypothetical protein
LQGGGDIGQQGGIVAVEFGVQHALGQRLDALGVEGGQPRQVLARGFGRCRGDGGGDLHEALAPGRIARPGLRRQRRHAVLAGQRQLRGIGQRQRRQRLQGSMLGATQRAEEAQPVAEAVAGGELVEALCAGGKNRRRSGGDDVRRLAARLDQNDGGLGGGAHGEESIRLGTYKRPAGRSPRVWIGRKLPGRSGLAAHLPVTWRYHARWCCLAQARVTVP